MQKKYKGILLFSKVFKENDLFIKFLSSSDELISGIIYGGLSKKKRNIIQVGFNLIFDVSTKPNMPPSIKAELTEPYIALIIDDKYKLNCLMSVTSLINLSIIEGQTVKDIYKISEYFLKIMYNQKKWLKEYFVFLFKLLKIIGYEIDLYNNNKKKYFNLETLEFTNSYYQSTIEFPHHLFDNNITKIDVHSINEIFKIFEFVFIKYHLSNFNLSLPNQYQLFKKLILNRLNSNE
tara:strand:+ start:2231 stop:2935 length:705 start_codon:yes stop_codon:yes gene_type:complete